MEKKLDPGNTDINPLTQAIHDELRRNGAKSWTGLPSDEELDQLRRERDQRRHADEDRCAARRVAELEKLKDEVMEVTRRSRRNSRE
jgi:leucyl aminopeptidase (aminopeptidase T)